MRGGQIKVKSELPVNKVAPPHGELQIRMKKVASPQRRKCLVNKVISPRGELQTPSRQRKRPPPLSISSATQSHKKIRTTSDVGVVGSRLQMRRYMFMGVKKEEVTDFKEVKAEEA